MGSLRWLLVSCVAAIALAIGACGGSATKERLALPEVYGHVHGLGVNPADGSLFVATHTGLFRAAEDETRLARVGRLRRDTMGFTVVARNTFLASGHPDAREKKPSHLGLVVSEDAGRSWRDLSLGGQADLHVIRVGSRLTYGFDSLSGALFVSSDSASSWSVGQPPESLFDLALDPRDERHLIGAAENGLYRSSDRGAEWRRIAKAETGFLAWSRAGSGVVLTLGAGGSVRRSRDAGRSWERVGDVGGEPTAASSHADDFYVATSEGQIKVSRDGGRTWIVRAEPPA